MSRFPVDAPKARVVEALEGLGFRVVRDREHIAMIRDNPDGTRHEETAMPWLLRFHGLLVMTIGLQVLAIPGTAQDRLEPVVSPFSQYDVTLEYHLRVRKLLLEEQGGPHLARVVCLPSFVSEWSVTIVGNDEDGYILKDAEVSGERNLGFGDAVPPMVVHHEVSIDGAMAREIHNAWRSMLLLTEYPVGGPTKAIADGVSYHFSCFHPKYGVLEGRISNPEVEFSATRTLSDIGWMLHQYAKAPQEEREGRLLEVREKLDELLAYL